MPQTNPTSKKPVIIICGPIAEEGKPAMGGYQNANRRVIRVLRELGYEVEKFDYPKGASTSLGKLASYLAGFTRIFLRLFTAPRRPTSFHLTPLIKTFLPAELLFCFLAKSKGMKLVVDLRAGTQIIHYETRSAIYRMMYRKMIRISDAISFEGEIYNNFVGSISPNTPRYLLPNFVADDEISVPPIAREMHGPKLIYVGFVSEAKGALHAALTLEQLQRIYPTASLTLVGEIDERCRNKIAAINIKHITFTGSLPQTNIQEYLDKSHYFVFLTKWLGEGHSNALTEAMARGCVPVFSVHGFNESIISNTGIRIKDRDNTRDIAVRIVANWQSASYTEMAHRSASRVFESFNDTNARHVLRKLHGSISED